MRQPIKINKTNPNKGVLDYSYLLDAPAGKHGFVTTRNGHFYFEDGVRAKFLGFNVALDYEKGNGREFHPEGLDRFDYFVAKLKERGIYLHIDLIVARDFVEGDGLDYPGNAGSCIKRFPMYNKRMIELQKEYAR